MRAARVAALVLALAGPGPAVAGEVLVVLDQARVMPMPAGVGTIIVGNPMIADATVQNNNTLMVITGKGYGSTNLMLLDSKGALVAEHVIRVSSPRDGMVNVYRGAARQTYSCVPQCERAAVLGDATEHFDAALAQSGSRNAQAQGGSAAK